MKLEDLKQGMKVLWTDEDAVNEGIVEYVNHKYGVFKIIFPAFKNKDGKVFKFTVYDPLFLYKIQTQKGE